MEAVNKIIKHNMKTKPKEHKGVWANELLKMLWAYRMTFRISTRETPFSPAYIVEAMIPVEVGIPSLRLRPMTKRKTMLFNSMNSTCSKKNAISRLSGLPGTKGGLSDISIQKSRKEGLKKATLFSERFCLTPRRSTLECLGLIGKGPTS